MCLLNSFTGWNVVLHIRMNCSVCYARCVFFIFLFLNKAQQHIIKGVDYLKSNKQLKLFVVCVIFFKN